MSKRRKLSHEPGAMARHSSISADPEATNATTGSLGPGGALDLCDGTREDGSSPFSTSGSGEVCSICLHDISRLATVRPCNHQYDLACINKWLEISNTCPLCKASVDSLHELLGYGRSIRRDVHKVRSCAGPIRSVGEMLRRRRRDHATRRLARWGSPAARQQTRRDDMLERQRQVALHRRRYVYDHGLAAFHVGTNSYSEFTNFSVQDLREDRRGLRGKCRRFLRRELQVVVKSDRNREKILQYVVDKVLMQLDVQSPGALRLVAEAVGDANAAATMLHERRTFLRSPHDDLDGYDRSELLYYGRELEPPWESADYARSDPCE